MKKKIYVMLYRSTSINNILMLLFSYVSTEITSFLLVTLFKYI